MAEIAPMLGAIFGAKHASTGKAAKSKSAKAAKKVAVVIHEHSPMANAEHKMPTDNQMIRERAKSEMRSATDSWVSGHMTTKEHGAVVARAKHVLAGKHPHEFKGPSGERKMKLR